MNLLQEIEKPYIKHADVPFKVGDLVRVHVRIVEGKRERVQPFEGYVMAIRGAGVRRTFRVRRESHGVGIERVFPVNSPHLDKIEIIRKGKVRRAKLYYLRQRSGKAAQVKQLL